VAVAVAISLLVTVFCGEALSARIAETHTTEIECIRPPAGVAATRVPRCSFTVVVDHGAGNTVAYGRECSRHAITCGTSPRWIVGSSAGRGRRRCVVWRIVGSVAQPTRC